MTFAVKERRLIDRNLVGDIRRDKEPRGRARFLSDAERSALLDACARSKWTPLRAPSTIYTARHLTAVAEAVEQRFPVTGTELPEVQTVRYVNGIALNYPVWCLTRHKRDLKNQYSAIYYQFSTEELLEAFSEANMITVELVELLRRVQSESYDSSV
jgi:hypothetical protein